MEEFNFKKSTGSGQRAMEVNDVARRKIEKRIKELENSLQSDPSNGDPFDPRFTELQKEREHLARIQQDYPRTLG